MKTNLLYMFVACAVLLLLSALLNVLLLLGSSKRQKGVVSDTLRITVVDTITYRLPIAVDSVVLRYETAILPHREDTPGQKRRTDSITVEVPITQKRYSDSTYTVWVSGYHPMLDSIRVYPRREIITVTNTIPRTKRWGLGVNAGYGFSPAHGLQPYIGIGVQYNLLSF
nr:MAG TPA: hypothetical protein [Caudoviricetes sp.]